MRGVPFATRTRKASKRKKKKTGKYKKLKRKKTRHRQDLKERDEKQSGNEHPSLLTSLLKSDFFAPSRTANAKPCVISPALGPTKWNPITYVRRRVAGGGEGG